MAARLTASRSASTCAPALATRAVARAITRIVTTLIDASSLFRYSLDALPCLDLGYLPVCPPGCSFGSQRRHWIGSSSSLSGQTRREYCYQRNHDADHAQRGGIARADAEEQASNRTGQPERAA